MARKIKSFFLRFCKETKAVTVVEFAFVGPIYLALLFGIIEAGLTMLFTASMDFGLQSAIRAIQIDLNKGILAPTNPSIQAKALTVIKNQLFGIHNVMIGNTPVSGKIILYNQPSLIPLYDSNNNHILTLLVLKSVYKRLIPSKFLSDLLGRTFFEIESSAVGLNNS